MNSLQLNLTKPGDATQKLSLNLSKGASFKARLSWDGATDLDLHALVAVNTGNGAKVSSFGDILSTYNVQRTISGQSQGTLPLAADKTFSIYGGALTHSPDAIDGHAQGDDEFVIIYPDRLTPPANGVLEIPLVATIHPQTPGRNFSQVQNAHLIIEDEHGKVLLDVSLSKDFAEFVGVQVGSVVIEAGQSSYANIGVGFKTDFNDVLGFFS